MRALNLSLELALGIGAASGAESLAISLAELKCEYRVNPQGIGTTQPRLSWLLNSEQRGQKQTAYRILVARSEAKLQADIGELWDSGKVVSDQSIQVLDIAQQTKLQRDKALLDAAATWYESWYPRVAEANGRRFLHELDDVKDHVPDRTVDMRFLIHRELLLPFGNWVVEVQSVRNQYAQKNNLKARDIEFDWKDVETFVPADQD